MAGDTDGGAYDAYAPRSPKSSKKAGLAKQQPDLQAVADHLEADDAGETFQPIGDTDAVAAALKDAEGDDALLFIGAADPRPGQTLDGMKPGEWQPDIYGLPPDCPVLPLGTEEGLFFFLDTIGQLRVLKDGELGQAGINSLFMGRHWYLYWAFPKKNAEGSVTSWRPEKAREVLMGACARKGPWSPLNGVRGRGIWKDRQGKLILHCGDRLFFAHGEEPLGEIEGRVYPTRPPIARPWPMSLMGKRGPAAKLIPHFQTWKWVRPRLDPILLIGGIGVGYLGGASPYRPATYTLGDKATGKSALHDDLKALQGEWLLHTSDTTSAGLYQQLKYDCIPVAIDEFEAKADNRKQKAVVELMRLSFSGAPMNRGGDNHKGTQFQGRSSFRFSSINMPAMEPQDLSRLAILRLLKLPKGAIKPMIPEEELAELGRKILRRLMDNWHRWNATYEAWREFLASCGHDGRGQDTFGTLMAVADLVIDVDAVELELEIGPNAENFESWRELLTVENLSEFQDAAENWQNCLTHLLSKRIEAWRGGARHTVGEVLTEFWEADASDKDVITFVQARRMLEQTGLTVLKPKDRTEHYELLIPNQHTLLHELFRDSKWQGELTAGTWSGALRQAPEEIWRDGSARINGIKFKGVAIALKDIIVNEAEARS
ncbi:hypothetical protein [Mesorhizobium sp. M1399]|uniref:hypothetical protein n=1 Tax=Mesorhizobium sp. M1399 TaxID=2957096 RepID=UPI00333B8054